MLSERECIWTSRGAPRRLATCRPHVVTQVSQSSEYHSHAFVFARATATIMAPEKKSLLRKSSAQIHQLRQILSFWFQPGVAELHLQVLGQERFKELEDSNCNV